MKASTGTGDAASLSGQRFLGRPNVTAFSDGGPLEIPAAAPATITEGFLETASRFADRGILYVKADRTEQFLSYASLLCAARRVLSGLRERGLGPGNAVILQLEDLSLLYTAFWGCTLGGLVPVTVAVPPTGERDNGTVHKLRGAWELLGRPAVLCQERSRARLLSVLASPTDGHEARVIAIEEVSNNAPAEHIHQSQPDDILFYQLTSGSTGVPKCIQETHRGIVAHVHATSAFNAYSADNIVLNWLPADHVAPLVVCHLRSAYMGCQQIHAQPQLILSNPRAWLELIETHRVTHTWSPNFGYKLVAECLEKDPSRHHDLSSIKFFLNAGEQLLLPVIEEFLRLVERFGTRESVMQPAFGMAETCTGVTYNNDFAVKTGAVRVARASLAGALHHAKPDDASAITYIDLGRPVPGIQLRIVDDDNQVIPEGVIGNLQIKGTVVTPGYYRNPEANQAAFCGDGWFESGDHGFLAEGRLYVTGRKKEIIIVRGSHFSCSEIEDLVSRIPGVEPTYVGACSAVEPETGSEGLAIFFVAASDRPRPNAAIARDIRSEIATKFGVRPFSVIPIEREVFPKSTSGKIQRTQLKAWLEEGRDDVSQMPATAKEVFAAHDSAATDLAAIEQYIGGVLKDALSLEHVRLDDNFFDLGGSSLALLQIQGRLEADLKREVRAADLFRYPTVGSLARHLAGVDPAAVMRRRPAERGREEIAIIGMAGRFPKATNIESFWRNLATGIDSVSEFTREQLEAAGVDRTLLDNPHYVKSAAVLDDPDMFAASFFGYSPREAARMDPQQRLFLEACWEALEHAGYASGTFDGPIGLFGGSTINTYGLAGADLPGTMDMNFVSEVMSLDKDFLTTRISYKLDLKGPSINVQAACSTGLVAVHMACLSLLAGEADLALAGAFSVRVPHRAGHLYQPGGIFSASGRCRSFDADADGTLFGNGGGVVVLKRLSDALADGDTIHAVVKGSAVNNDGALKAGYTAPGVEGQINVLRSALARAAISSDTISYVEAHGSATALGDAIEVAALHEVFGPRSARATRCALGTVKTNIGHLDAAAGIAGLIKTVLMLENRTIPPSLHFRTPNKELERGETPFYVPTTLSSWQAGTTPRRAGVSAFGIGGTNAHVILEEAPARPTTSSTSRGRLLVLSAKTESALERARLDLVAHLHAHPELDLRDVASTLQRGRQNFTHRCAVVCHDLEDAANALSSPDSGRLLISAAREAVAITFYLSGQTSPADWLELERWREERAFADAVHECLTLLPSDVASDLHRILGPAAAEDVEERSLCKREPRERGVIQEVANFVLNYALARLWMSWGVKPRTLIGTGAGKHAAACLSGALPLEEALARTMSRSSASTSPEDLQRAIEGQRTLVLDMGMDPEEARLGSIHVSSRPSLLDALGRLYVEHATIDWSAFCRREPFKRVPLPTYPFERQRYWIDLPPRRSPRRPPTIKNADPARWFYVPSWTLAPVASRADVPSTDWLIFDDESPLGSLIAAEVWRTGSRVIVVRPANAFSYDGFGTYTIDPVAPGDYLKLAAALQEKMPERVLHLWSLVENHTGADVVRRGFESLISFAQALEKTGVTDGVRIDVVGNGAHDVTGDEPIVPEAAASLAACRAIPQEFANLTCRYLDVGFADPSTLVAHILAESSGASTDAVVAYRGRRRWVQTFTPHPLEELSTPQFRQGGVYLITGGLGRVGLVIAEHLARSYRAKLVLTSRSGMSGTQRDADTPTARKVRELESLGAEVVVVAADVADVARMRELLGHVEDRFGRLHGVIHAAGAMRPGAFSTIARWTPGQLDEHLRPKVGGLLALHEVLPDALDFCVICSSLSSVVGGLGLCGYAAANLIVDAFVERLHQRRRPGMTPWLSLNWDYWQLEHEAVAGMSAADSTSQRRDLALTPAEGIVALTRALAVRDAIPRIVISTADLDVRLDCGSRMPAIEMRRESTGDRLTAVSARRSSELSELQRDPQEIVAGIWRDILGVDAVGVHDDFFALGGDSFQAICLVDRLKEDLDIDVPVHELFRSPTIAQLLARWPPRSPRARQSGTKADPGSMTAVAASLRSDQFDAGAGASIDDKKRRMREFYDRVTDQLAATDVGQHSHFLNLGYEPDRPSNDEARIHISDHLINSSSIRLVHEVLGDDSLDARCEVLDAGCGRGGTISQIQQHFPVKHITGIDLSPRAIAFCKQHHGASNTRFLEGDAEALPFANQSFDVVLNIESSHSYPNIEAFYQEVRRVLKPGGRFLYADVFPVEQWGTLRTRLLAAGLTCLHERDITANVLRACDRVAGSRIRAFAADNDVKVMADFLAAPGSRLHDDMISGRSSYRILQLAPIAPPSQQRVSTGDVLVQLQPGDPTRRPLFLVHPVGGTVFQYQAFADHLGDDQPVYGLRASGLDRGEEFDGEIERMAGRYELAIRTRQPYGPYLIGGWSFGGLVAYEIAQRLRKRGENVDLLVLVDTPVPGKLPADLDRFVPQPPRVLPDVPAFARIVRQNLDAMRQYRAKSYAGHVLLARATEWPTALPIVPETSWQALIDGTLDLIDVQANHFTIMAPPHIQVLAEQLKRTLSGRPTTALRLLRPGESA